MLKITLLFFIYLFFTRFTNTTSFILSRVRNPTIYLGSHDEEPTDDKESIVDEILDHIYEDTMTQKPVSVKPLKYKPPKWSNAVTNRSLVYQNSKKSGTSLFSKVINKSTIKFPAKQPSVNKNIDDIELQSVMLRPALKFQLPKYVWNDVDSITNVSSTTQVQPFEDQTQYEPWPTMIGLSNIPWKTRATMFSFSPQSTTRIWPTLWPKYSTISRQSSKIAAVKFVVNKDLRRASKPVSQCYECGLRVTVQEGIPVDSDCHNIFSSPSYEDRSKIEKTKMSCFYRDNDTLLYNGRAVYGKFSGGCYKRFLDIGTLYTERGCRTVPYGVAGYSIISPRFVRLQYLLDNTKNGCVISPFAVFTPFNRAVSLFVRYHVCVCEKDFCNKGNVIQGKLMYVFAFSLFYFYIL